MYSEKITYKDYNGNDRTETIYLNLTKSEMLVLDTVCDGGLEAYLMRIMETQKGQEVIDAFEMVLSKSYGQKSLDGRRFVKNPELYQEFKETEAYNEFFFKLVTDAEYAAKVINGIVSSVNEDPAFQAKIEDIINQSKDNK